MIWLSLSLSSLSGPTPSDVSQQHTHIVHTHTHTLYRSAVHSSGPVYVPHHLCTLSCLLVPLDPRWLCQRQLLLCHNSRLLTGSGSAIYTSCVHTFLTSTVLSVSLLSSTLQVFLVSDVMYSFLVHRYDLTHGLPRVDSTGQTIALALT